MTWMGGGWLRAKAVEIRDALTLPDGRRWQHEAGSMQDGLALVVGSIAPDPPLNCPMTFLHAADSRQANRLLNRDEVREQLKVVLVEEDLVDSSGLSLLSRLMHVAPAAARVLLLAPEDLPYQPEDLVQLGLDDSWPTPPNGRALVRDLLQRRAALARTRALHGRLDEFEASLVDLERRCMDLRDARDLLVRNVPAALATNGPVREAMELWWRGCDTWLQLRSGICPIDLEEVTLGEFFGKFLGRPELQHWHWPRALPVRETVYLDRAMMKRTGILLLRGLSELTSDPARCRWGRLRADSKLMVLELKVEPIRDEIEHDVELLLNDPYARLPDGRLHDLSIDLPLAQEYLRVQDAAISGDLVRPQLVVELTMRRSPPEI